MPLVSRRPREGNSTPIHYSRLENPMDGRAWWAAVHAVAEGRTWLSDFTFTFHFHALEKEMATHSSVLAWRIPGTESLVGCGLWGCTVGHNWSDLAAVAAAVSRRPCLLLLIIAYGSLSVVRWDQVLTFSYLVHRHSLESFPLAFLQLV